MPRLQPLQSLMAIAWLACAAGAARAATITETIPFTIQSAAATNFPPQTINVSTPQFNPALGTFENGATTITGAATIALEFFNTGAGGPYDVFLTDTLSLAGIPGLFGEELTGILPANQPAFIVSPVTFPYGPVDRGDPAELVVGTGTWNQLYSLPFASLTVKQGPSAILPAIVISGSSVTTYTYTPATTAVPEPRTAGVLALLLGLCVVRLIAPSYCFSNRQGMPR
jgi:hypothetical protein